ncbi:MAG: hypothetical protein LBP33_12545 [Candidatus Adiutrix sp.]|jgi:hypothetical protein|nr:hypothetical protein [Candidatus Adiutrix sp.]
MLKPSLTKTWPWLALALIALWPLLIVNRGFDLGDTGYYLAQYRYAFSDPEYLSLLNILSSWLGGLIYALAPGGQLLALKIAAAGFYAAIAYFSFVILREHFPDWLVLTSLALSSLYANAFYYSANYNTFSYLFLSAAIFLIYRGLQKDRKAFLLMGAALLGFNVFVRLPNILQWPLAIAPFWYYWVCLGRRARGLTLGLYFMLSLGAAFLFLAAVGLLSLGQGGFDGQIDRLFELIRGTRQTGHGALTILDRLTDNLTAGYYMATVYAPQLLGGSALILALMIVGRRHPAVVGALGLAGPVIGLLAGFLIYFGQQRPGTPILFTAVFSFYSLAGPLISLAGLWHYHQRNPLLSTLCGMGAVVLLAMPVGSDSGVEHYAYYSHLSLGLCLGLVYRFWREGAGRLQKRWPAPEPARWLKAAAGANLIWWAMLGLALHLVKAYDFRSAFLDAPYRLTTTAVEGVGALAGMRTNPARARALSRLAENLKPFNDTKILAFGNCPICLVLTDSEPFFKNLWVDLFVVTGDEFIADLNEAAARGELPIVLISQRNSSSDIWRLRGRDLYKERLLNIFLRDQKYVLHSVADYFYLYLPPRLAEAGATARRPGMPEP